MSLQSGNDVQAAPYVYELPREKIAQRPVHPPESARMLVVNRSSGEVTHATFADIGQFLRAGDRLVFNETKVIPARLFGQAAGSYTDVLLVEQLSPSRWVCLGRPLKRIKAAGTVVFGDALRAEVVASDHIDRVVLDFSVTDPERSLQEAMHESGTMPIPPYIRSGYGDDQDRLDYQSIFARNEGSIAAPTASLHFSEGLINQLREAPGCEVSRITLHVGTASFQPIFVDGALRPPAQERFVVSSETIDDLRRVREGGGRVVAVGTTTTRALETVGSGVEGQGTTALFIQPGFQFAFVDALVTNFHQPGTTHLLLVEALLGRTLLEKCYSAALSEGYRFLSYGDGMLIV